MCTPEFTDLVGGASVDPGSEVGYRVRFALEGLEDCLVEDQVVERGVKAWVKLIKQRIT